METDEKEQETLGQEFVNYSSQTPSVVFENQVLDELAAFTQWEASLGNIKLPGILPLVGFNTGNKGQSQDFRLIGVSCSVKVQLISTSSALPEMFGTGEPIKSQNQPSQISAYAHLTTHALYSLKQSDSFVSRRLSMKIRLWHNLITWPQLTLDVRCAALLHLLDEGPPAPILQELSTHHLESQDGSRRCGTHPFTDSLLQDHVPCAQQKTTTKGWKTHLLAISVTWYKSSTPRQHNSLCFQLPVYYKDIIENDDCGHGSTYSCRRGKASEKTNKVVEQTILPVLAIMYLASLFQQIGDNIFSASVPPLSFYHIDILSTEARFKSQFNVVARGEGGSVLGCATSKPLNYSNKSTLGPSPRFESSLEVNVLLVSMPESLVCESCEP
uniref:(California timema) hypothetical protein n=1 Tax=Timema californicum TaxID=61474 RepID=A0A7R9P7K9_TIMCA|nr:unnamed protein product [Timema californicum]